MNDSCREPRPSATLSISRIGIQLHIPIEIVAPTFGGIANADGNRDDWIPPWLDRFSGQTHVRFVGGSSALAIIAPPARCDDIFPRLFPALRDRHDVIECQIFGLELVVAILAGIAVARKNIDPGKLDRAMAVFELDHLKQPHDRRQFDRNRDAMNLTIIDL